MIVMARRLTGIALALLAGVAPAHAQEVARFSADSVISVGQFAGHDTGNRLELMTLDGLVALRLGRGWQAYVRPVLRRSRPLEWDAQICQAAVRYERRAAVAIRFDAGYIASPVGLGMLDARADVNPVMTAHPNYVSLLPAFEPGVPRAQAIAAIYPLGAAVTVAGARWDSRLAIVDTAPTRVRQVFGTDQPRRTPVFEAGAGVTPRAGLRVGFAVARGAYLTREEAAPPAAADRRVTLVGLEAEYSFGHTKMSGEWIHDAFETAADHADVHAWFVQVSQTLTPRWFVAVRDEGSSAPTLELAGLNGPPSRSHLVDANVGFRVTRELTVRAGSLVRKASTRSGVDHQFGISLVWARRWW